MKKIANMLRIIICWNVIFFLIQICKSLIENDKVTITLLTLPTLVIRSMLQKTDAMWQLWYLAALNIIYFMLPVLSRLSKKRKLQLLFILASIMVFMDVCSYVAGRPVQRRIPQTFRLWTWLFYFTLGGVVRGLKEFFCRLFSLKVHALIAGIFTIIVISYQLIIGWDVVSIGADEWLRAEYFYDDILEVFWIMILFLLALRVDTRKITRYIIRIAPLTMGIYIIHPLIRDATVLITGNSSFIEALLYWILTFALSYLVTDLLNRMRIGRKLVRL